MTPTNIADLINASVFVTVMVIGAIVLMWCNR